MQISAALVSYLFPTPGGGANTLLSIIQGQATAAASAPKRDPIATLVDAEKNAPRLVAAKAQEPAIRREIDSFVSGVLEAETVDDLFNNPKAMKVLLTANGLEDFAQYKGLYTKALQSDPDDPQSLAVRLASTNAAWLNTARTYRFASEGLGILKDPDTISAIADAYAEVRWRQSLDASAPGVSNALTFKDIAATLDSPFKVLGNKVARDVVTTALGLPPQIAYQTVDAQAKAITTRLDLDKLKNPAFVDMFVRRYLIALNSTGGGLVA